MEEKLKAEKECEKNKQELEECKNKLEKGRVEMEEQGKREKELREVVGKMGENVRGL